jgi:hypothetical protein
MISRVVRIVIVLAGALASQVCAQSPTRFQSEIDAFAKSDSASPPAPGGIVFVGSSIVRLWKTVTQDMAPLPVVNRGFGGSQTPDVLSYMDRIIIPYRPRIVVYYCGSNDVNAGASATAIAGRVREFHQRLERALPGTRMFFVSVIRAPDKRKRWAVVDSVNADLRQYATTARNVEFVDVNPVLLDAGGNIRAALYLPDSLHYRPEAYTLFTSVVKPVLQRAWSSP